MDAAAQAVEPQPILMAGPVAGADRITLIDALRGFALFGVLTANIWLWFSGTFMLFPDYQTELQRLSADSLSYFFINTLISGKFVTLFSFLFGLGFSIQLQRAGARGETVTRLYARRLLILLAFGVTHGVLIWYGDILLSYSLLGFGLLFFGRRQPRTLLIWMVLLIFVWPLAIGALAVAGGDSGAGAMAEQFRELNSSVRPLFLEGGYTQILEGNVRILGFLWSGQYIFFFPYIFGVFLGGLLVGRIGVLARPGAFLPILKRMQRSCLLVAVPANAVLLYMAVRFSMIDVFSRPELLALQQVLFPLAVPTLAALYAVTIILLYQSPVWKSRLDVLAPVGRMALSNYLAHSFICIGIYYGIGFGLMDAVGPATTIPIALAIFTGQIFWSRWWLQHYRFGPAEWLWRSLSYGERQSMVKVKG